MEAVCSLSSAAAQYFSLKTRNRGQCYANAGSVYFEIQTPTLILANVLGRNDYTVIVSRDPDDQSTLEVSCSCPHFDDGSFCKHLWATLLSCDEKEVTFEDLKIEDLELCYRDQEMHAEEVDELLGRDQDFSNNPQQINAEVKLDSWQTLLQQVQNSDNAPATLKKSAQYEIYYILDLAHCLSKQGLVFELLKMPVSAAGDYSKLRQLEMYPQSIENSASDSDSSLYRLLQNSHNLVLTEYERRFQAFRHVHMLTMHPSTYEGILRSLCETGRCFWRINSDQELKDSLRLRWDDEGAYHFEMSSYSDDEKKEWKFTGHMVRGESRKAFSHDIVLVVNSLMLLSDGTLARVRKKDDDKWIGLFSRQSELRVPFEERGSFLSTLYQTPNLPALQLPEELKPKTQTVPPQPKLYLNNDPSHAQYLCATVCFLYEDVECKDDGQKQIYLPEEHAICERDADAEAACLSQLDEMDIRVMSTQVGLLRRLRRIDFIPSIEKLLELGWQVNAEGCEFKNSNSHSMNITSGIDWFDLQGEFEFDGETVEIPELLKAVRKGEKWIELSNGKRGLLPSQWLDRYGQALKMGEQNRDGIRFRPSQAMIIDSILEGQPNVSVDKVFKNLRKKLANINGVKPRTEPKTFQGRLRDYQRDGLGWLSFLKDLQFGGCLADDMGLGKTVQILAMLEERRKRRLKKDEVRKPTLVIVPKSLVFNWQEEAAKFSPKLSVIPYIGLERSDFQSQIPETNVIITTYGTLRRDVEFLSTIEWDYVILDEAQAIKNPTSQTAKACRTLQSTHRLAATGTPIENSLNELWSLFEFLNPGMLGRSTVFNNAVKDAAQEPEKLHELAKAVAPYVLRRTKSEVLKDLPDKTELTLHCEFSKKHRKEYDQLRDHFQLMLSETIKEKGIENSKIHVLEALLRLRQAACHPGLIDKKRTKESSAKIEMLMEHLTEVVSNGHKALVFSQFTSLLNIVKSKLDKAKIVYEYLDGKTSNRQERVERFQTDENISTFLISLKAGGTGLNLTAADYVFILDPWWNPAAEAQAIDRAHRIGQHKKVTAYRIITKDTIEDKVAELQVKKKSLADAIISTNDHLLKSLSAADLQMLFS